MSDNLGNKDAKTLDSSKGLQESSTYARNGIRPEPANTNTQKDGMSVSSQVTVGPIKKVDSYHSDKLGDTAKESLNKAAAGHGAFDTMGGQKMGQFPLRGGKQ